MTEKRYLPVAVSVCSLFLVSQVYGAPSINGVSGAISDKNVVTITGNGFGGKPSAKPILWDTFERGNNGAFVATSQAVIGQWQDGFGSDAVRYSSAHPHAGKLSTLHAFNSTDYNISLSQNFPVSRLYMDYWVYIDYKDNKSRNWKLWRLYGDNDAMQLNYVNYCNGESGNYFHDRCGLDINDWQGMPYKDNSWYHIQVLFKESGPNATDGVLKQYINGSLRNNYRGKTRCNSAHLDQIRIGHYWATDAVSGCPANGGANVYIDNVYIDTSWSHVELGNKSTYSSSTLREVQIPSSWSDKSLVVTVNQGAFKAGDTAYLYVSDLNGNVNDSGYPIVIGAAGSNNPAPSAPENLKVLE